MADDNTGFLQVSEVDLFVPPHEVVQHPRRNVAHVRRPLAEVFVLDRAERFGVLIRHLLKGELGRDFFLGDDAVDLVDQRRIFQHQQMGVEYAGVLGAHALIYLALNFENLPSGLHQGLLQTLDLLR